MEPSDLHPDLTWERLGFLARVIAHVRHDAVLMHQPEKGDNAWSLGCRVFARTCFAFAQHAAARDPDWLRIIDSESHFVVVVGTVPVRFYSGDPSDPPSRALKRNNLELEAQQYALQLVTNEISTLGIVRLIIEKNQDFETLRVTLVNLDQDGRQQGTWTIPLPPIDGFGTSSPPSSPDLQPKGPTVLRLSRRKEGVPLPPADVRPSRRQKEEQRDEEQ